MSIARALCEYKKVGACSIKCGVYSPPRGNGAAVVFMHGGALISGNRFHFPLHERRALLRAGYCVISIDYRLAPETKLPHIIEDVEDALNWVRREGAEAFGYDGDRLAVMGSSAGGYLALMTGTFPVKPKALVSIYGYGDILGDWYCKPDAFYLQKPRVSAEEAEREIGRRERTWGNRWKLYLRTRQTGTWTSTVSGYDIAKDRESIEAYCPLLRAAADYPPTLLLHGDQDTDVPYAQSVAMFEALKRAGVEVELRTKVGGDHLFDLDGKDADVRAMIDEMIAFLGKHV